MNSGLRRRLYDRVGPHVTAKRLLIVSGKGGVGKSTTAAALGLATAARGLRTIVAEVAGRNDAASLLGLTAAGSQETRVSSNLHHVTIDRRTALDEYLREEVPGPFPAAILTRSRAFQGFVDAAPGLQELLTIGKVWELTQDPRRRKNAQPYDVVVLDGPATGQLLALLQAPRTFVSIARAGPVARQGTAIERMLRDPDQTGVVIVATPEQMAVTETLELRAALSEALAVDLDAVVVNRAFPTRFSSAEARALGEVADDPAIRSARWLYGRARAQQAQVARLRRGLSGVPRVTLPYLFSETFDRGCVGRLAELLGRALL